MTGRRLQVLVNGQLVGELRESNDLWAFEYEPLWATAQGSFDLSPALPRRQAPHVDGATQRPVQWYFDNLLPEEALRSVLAKEAHLPADDAFGLLAYYGAESAGSLVLRSPDQPEPLDEGLRALPLTTLSQRIANLPRVSLTHDAPKRMSLAGAQHKMVVVFRDGQLFEPLPGTASTHILKPEHVSDDYPASVINEYFTMSLARAVGLSVPQVHRLYVPQPVYLVERFDRHGADPVLRRHAIDTCQLLNKSRSFKYSAAHLETLSAAALQCRARAAARLQLYRWLVFNVLVGNGDNHLKNISFLVSEEGIVVAPFYDLLSTAVYTTQAFADEKAHWPNVELALTLGNAMTFAAITRQHLLKAGQTLGLSLATAMRELDRLVRTVPREATSLLAQIESTMQEAVTSSPEPDLALRHVGGELRLLRAIVHIVIQEMAARCG